MYYGTRLPVRIIPSFDFDSTVFVYNYILLHFCELFKSYVAENKQISHFLLTMKRFPISASKQEFRCIQPFSSFSDHTADTKFKYNTNFVTIMFYHLIIILIRNESRLITKTGTESSVPVVFNIPDYALKAFLRKLYISGWIQLSPCPPPCISCQI